MFEFLGRSFHKAKYTESTEILCNPDRGFYQMFTIIVGVENDYDEFEACLVPTERLVFLMVDISLYREEDLPPDALMEIRRAIFFFKERNKDVILRVVYDHQGNALIYEPSLFGQVKSHMVQIAELLASCHQEIFVYQGLLVGNWGEMHTSKFVSKSTMRELVNILDEYLQGNVYLAVRRPCFYRQLRQELPQNQSPAKCKIGLYNDAILGSASDMGTYGEKDSTLWENPWKREQELVFQEVLCNYAPCGGESVLGDSFIYSLSPKDLLHTFQKMHLTYLNRLYDQRVLDYLRSIKLSNAGVWSGISLFRYIEAHLGYRFLVRNVNARLDRKNSIKTTVKLEISIENNGFSNFYREGELQLYVMDEHCGTKKEFYLGEINRISPGNCVTYEACFEILPGSNNKLHLHLGARRVCDHCQIHFGNKEEKDGRVYLGYLAGFRIEEVCL